MNHDHVNYSTDGEQKIWVLGSGEPLEDLIHLGKLQCFNFARQFGLEMAMKTKCLINENEGCPEHIMN